MSSSSQRNIDEMPQSYVELQKAVSEGNWEKAYVILSSMDYGDLAKIRDYLRTQGVDPSTVLSGIVKNYVAELVENQKYIDALETLIREKTRLPPDYVNSALNVILYNCALRNDTRCLDYAVYNKDLLGIKPENVEAILAGIYVASKKNPKSLSLLDHIQPLLFTEGLAFEASLLPLYLRKDELVDEVSKKLEEENEKFAKKVSEELKKAISSRDPVKIRAFLEKYGSYIRNVKPENAKDVNLYQILEALAQYYEIINEYGKYDEIVSSFISTVNEKLSTNNVTGLKNLNIDLSSVISGASIIEKLLNSDALKTLYKAGLIAENVVDEMRKLLGLIYLYIGYVMMLRNQKGYQIYLDKALKYNSELHDTVTMLKLASNTSIDLIECILREEGILPKGTTPPSSPRLRRILSRYQMR